MDFTRRTEIPQSQPKNWLVEAILATIFCCQPIGIVAIVFAVQVNSKYSSGDYEGAVGASKEAAKWTKISFYIGIFWVLALVIFAVFFGGLAILSGLSNSSNY